MEKIARIPKVILSNTRLGLVLLQLIAGTVVYPAGSYASPIEDARHELHDHVFLGGLPLKEFDAGFAAFQAPQAFEVAVYDHLLAGLQRRPAENIDMIETGSIIAGVFNSVAIPIHSFPVAKRWQRIMEEVSQCATSDSCSGDNDLLAAISSQIEGKSLLDKIRLVDSIVNDTLRYRTDQSLYDELDHWATPREILARASGDCEDFAILKMTALIRAGVPATSLSVVVLRDNNRGVFHAVLAVSTNSGNFILDNTRAKVAMDTDLPNYQPLYSLSDHRAWIHGSKSPSRDLMANSRDFSSIAPGEGDPSDGKSDVKTLRNASLRTGLAPSKSRQLQAF
ncbi:transglutaminase-like cysteine peptidase [Mesorhizobium sp. BAC0120]|uniref:transglutaminase-like cysteine peptidase n=1 Tax=Mesorhizobium sp. BAC0120 TaxID=3090670 RepID=UPI00298C4B5A|nr:transglutaminase-like cysteine peptidase [Mesorhizobium sp. BAC0120]MDW6026544.1 transglutaminase-like cysteine peptidase [Mesorhizobium sp. BAC0120]